MRKFKYVNDLEAIYLVSSTYFNLLRQIIDSN